jgi:hypothetical protein
MSAQGRWSDTVEKKMRGIRVLAMMPERTVICRFEESALLWHPVTVKKIYLVEGKVKNMVALCPVHHHPIRVE